MAVDAMSFMVAQATAEPLRAERAKAVRPKRAGRPVKPESPSMCAALHALLRDRGGIPDEAVMAAALGVSEARVRLDLWKLVFGGQAYFDGVLWRAVE